MKIEDMK